MSQSYDELIETLSMAAVRTVYVDPATVYREAVAYEAAVARAKKRASRKGAR